MVCKWGCCVSFSRWKEPGACLRWPGNGAYPTRAQASPGLRSLRALPNKSGETAGCQHSYRPSLSPRRPPLRAAVRTVHRPGLSRAVCYQRSQTPMEKRRGACFTALPERKTWREKVEKLALFLIKLHLTETSSVLKRRWKKEKKALSEPAVWLGLFLLRLPDFGEYFYMAHANIRADTWYPSVHRPHGALHLSSYQQSQLQQVPAYLNGLYTGSLQYTIVFSYHRRMTRSTMLGCGKVLGSPRILSRSTAAPGGSGLRHIIRNSGPRASSRLCCALLFLLLILTPRVDSSWWWVASSIPTRRRWRTPAHRSRAFFFSAHGDWAAVSWVTEHLQMFIIRYNYSYVVFT